MILHRLSAERNRLIEAIKEIGVDEYALRMVEKGLPLNVLVKDVKSPAANILKQEAIASGMDAAVKRGVVSCSVEYTDVLLLGCRNSYLRLIKRLKVQPFGLDKLSSDLKTFINTGKRNYFIAGGKKISTDTPLVMGILNVTPDSFSDGGTYLSPSAAEKRINQMMKEGVDVIDIGGMSSRPGAEHIDSEEEILRITHALDYALSTKNIVSVDTCNYETARAAINKGATIINDISGLTSNEMARICGDSGAAVCIMHMNGIPLNMQQNVSYKNIISEIKDFFAERIEKAVKAGIMEESIILDLGFGFSKTTEQNYTLLKYLNEFDVFGMPLLVGVSRKSMIGNVTGRDKDERLAGTIAANAAALLAGADILRVHDVKQCVDTVKVINALIKAEVR